MSNERLRLQAETDPMAIELRKVWIEQIEREIEAEKKFVKTEEFEDWSDEELLWALQHGIEGRGT